MLVLAVLFMTLPGEAWIRDLALHGPAVTAGQWWRILTSQLVHLSVSHALLNVVGYLLVVYYFRRELTPTRELAIVLVSMLLVGLCISAFNPEILWYYGLSGALYALLVSCALMSAPRMPVICAALLVFVVGKVVYEQLFAPPDRITAQIIGGPVAIDAHLYGLVIGVFLGVGWLVRDRFSRKTLS